MVAMPKQNVPALRLEGFSGEWELKAIGELFAERNESFPEGELLSVTLRNGIKRFQEIGRHNTSNEDKSKYKLVEVGDIAYNSMRMWQGASGVSPWKGIVSPAYTVLKPVGSQDTPFFAYYFKTPFMIQVFQLNSQGLTSDTWNLKYPALSAIDICRPQDIEEQQAIGAIFTNLDAAIIQHTLKHKALQQSKTALMQRMFPQEGQTVPELRLEGFDGEWGSAPLQQLASLFTDGDWIESKDQSTEGIRLLQTGNVGIGTFVQKSATQKWISEETFKRLRCQEVLPGDILISRLPDPAGRACIVPMMPYRLITAVDCTIVRLSEENDADYLVAYLGNPSYFEHIDTLLAGGTRQRVSRSQLAAIEVPVPPTLEEQQAIGAVFTNLDQLIAAEAQYIASLKQAKTALLQRMFI